MSEAAPSPQQIKVAVTCCCGQLMDEARTGSFIGHFTCFNVLCKHRGKTIEIKLQRVADKETKA